MSHSKSFRKACTLAGVLFWAVASIPTSYGQLPATVERGKPTLAPLMRQVTPAVVNIGVVSHSRVAQNPLLQDPFFRRFFGVPDQPQQEEVPQQAAGSGVIIDAKNGYVLTNHHVIENADEITVNLADRRRFSAKLVGSDEGTDIALLQIEAAGLTALQFGDSDALQVGDFVVAIGNPFGLGQTVTSGIVSALGRTGLNIEGYEDFIQTDASINPGNSGGALVDLDGKLVGINSAILSPAGGNVGIGFAVPSNMAHAVMDQLLQYGEVRRGRLGITIQDVTPDLAKALALSVNEGAVVTEVQPDSAADKAGLMAGDVVTAINGRNVQGSSDLRNRIGLIRVGETVNISAIRDGRTLELKARIGEASGEEAQSAAGGSGSALGDRLQGARFANLDRENPMYGRVQGVLVLDVATDSPAWRTGLRANDIVVAVNRQPVANVEQLTAALRASGGSTFALNILRGDARLFIVVR